MRHIKPLIQSDFPLIIVKDIGMQFPTSNSKQQKRFALFICPHCDNTFRSEATSVKKRRATKCKSCHIRIKTTTHGETNTRLYNIWVGMRSRCNNSNAVGYANYGGRGITICKAWDDYTAFKAWAISAQYSDLLSIDRIDNDKGYLPSNCRWATRTTQARNTRVICAKNTTGYRGVYPEGPSFVASIGLNNKTYRIGTFATKELAAIAYDTFVIANKLGHTINKVGSDGS